MEQEYFYEIMYGWIESRNTESETEYQNGFDFARFVGHIMEASQK